MRDWERKLGRKTNYNWKRKLKYGDDNEPEPTKTPQIITGKATVGTKNRKNWWEQGIANTTNILAESYKPLFYNPKPAGEPNWWEEALNRGDRVANILAPSQLWYNPATSKLGGAIEKSANIWGKTLTNVANQTTTTPTNTPTDYSELFEGTGTESGGKPDVYKYIPGGGQPAKDIESYSGYVAIGEDVAKAWIENTNKWLLSQGSDYQIVYEWDPTGGINPWTGEWSDTGGFKLVRPNKKNVRSSWWGWGGGGGGGGGGKSYADWFNALYWKV